mmetsp:Transcript_22212/g.28753  ORF Transcript_22212/g.28753 Transcript_22212/m.28753 type:complete len:691 (+) Transcript_22212:21-2093(+)
MESVTRPTEEILESKIEDEAESSGIDGSRSPSASPVVGEGKKRRRRKKRGKKPEQGTVLSDDGALVALEHMLVRVNEDKGRYGIARRDLEAGTVIFEDLPMAFIISKPFRELYCARCGHYGAPEKCNNDPYHSYCSKNCRVKDAAVRVMEANAYNGIEKLAEDAEMDCDLLRMMAKILCKHVFNVKEKGEDEIWERMQTLQTHRDRMEASWLESVEKGLAPLLELLPESARVPLDKAMDLACQINTNAHGISDSTGGNSSVGFGIFPKVAYLNHSCKPNAIYTFREGVMAVRALAPIAAGEEITLHYIDLLQARADRQRELQVTRYFTCTCERCETPVDQDLLLQAICCDDCGEKGVLVRRLPDHLLPPEMRKKKKGEEPNQENAQTGEEKKTQEEGEAPAGNEEQEKTFVPSFLNGAGNVEALEAMKALGLDPEKDSYEAEVLSLPENICFCSICESQASQEEIDKYVQRVAMQRQQTEENFRRTRNYRRHREELEQFLEDFDAGTPSRKPKARLSEDEKKKKQCRLQLHPSHTLILYTLPQVANACNQLKDYLASAKYLRRLVKVMEELQPENFPETADFLFALGESLKNFLDARNANSALPKKTADQYRTEARNAFIRCHKIRTICLGPDNKATRDALKLMTAIGGADVNTYLATLPTPPIQGGEDGRSSPMILPPTALLQQQTQKS